MHTTTFKGEQVELHCTNGKCLIFLSLRVARMPPHIAIRGAIPPLRPSAETSGNSVSHHHAGPSPLRGGPGAWCYGECRGKCECTLSPPWPPQLRGGPGKCECTLSPPWPPHCGGGIAAATMQAPPHCGGGQALGATAIAEANASALSHHHGPPPLRGGLGAWCYGECRGKCECTLSPPWPPPIAGGGLAATTKQAPPHCGGGQARGATAIAEASASALSHHHGPPPLRGGALPPPPCPPIAGGHIWSLWKIQKQVLVHPLPPFFEDASDCGGAMPMENAKARATTFRSWHPLYEGARAQKKKILGLPCILHMWRMHGSAIAHMVYIIFVIHTHIYIYIYICVGVFLSTHTNISRPPMINWGPQKLTLN